MRYSAEERALVGAILDAPAATGPRLAYARWLQGRDEPLRASIVRSADPAGDLDAAELEAGLAALDIGYHDWARLIGARLVHEAHRAGLGGLVEGWLGLARPGVELVVGSRRVELPVGASKLGGDPDMPSRMPWPTLADCQQRWEPEHDLPLDGRCQFAAQINLTDLAGTPAARDLPDRGLLLLFCHHEWQETGSSSVCLRYVPDLSQIQRRAHPVTDEHNARRDQHILHLREALTLPDPTGPLAASVSRDRDTQDRYYSVAEASGGSLFGLLGHDRATTGDDPTPGPDWQRLITTPIGPHDGVAQHLAITDAALASGALEDATLVWVDFDGPCPTLVD